MKYINQGVNQINFFTSLQGIMLFGLLTACADHVLSAQNSECDQAIAAYAECQADQANQADLVNLTNQCADKFKILLEQCNEVPVDLPIGGVDQMDMANDSDMGLDMEAAIDMASNSDMGLDMEAAMDMASNSDMEAAMDMASNSDMEAAMDMASNSDMEVPVQDMNPPMVDMQADMEPNLFNDPALQELDDRYHGESSDSVICFQDFYHNQITLRSIFRRFFEAFHDGIVLENPCTEQFENLRQSNFYDFNQVISNGCYSIDDFKIITSNLYPESNRVFILDINSNSVIELLFEDLNVGIRVFTNTGRTATGSICN